MFLAACSADPSAHDWSGTAGSAAATSGTNTSPTDSTSPSSADADTGDGGVMPKLDLAVPDAGGGGPDAMPTCDTLPALGPTALGCEFWAIDTNVGSGTNGLGIGVGNPWDVDVTVHIEDARGAGGMLRDLGSVALGPRESAMVTVNGPGGLLPGEDHMVWPGLNEHAAFRITSDVPIDAMQINPVGGASSMVPDASMLVPTTSLDEAYYAIGYGPYNGFAIAIAITDGTTVSTSEGDVVLDAFDAYGWYLDDATGLFLGADAPIAVFSGNSCTQVPAGVPWCDHVEEQVLPLSTWGTRYVGARHPPRLPAQNPVPEAAVWRVFAATDDTMVTFTPAVSAPVQLDHAGDFAEFATAESFVAESDDDRPFLLVQFMTGGTSVGTCAPQGDDTATGDPYMVQMVPIEQWLTALPFLTDTTYVRDFVVVTREAGTSVDLACLGPIPDDKFTPIVGTPYEVAWVDLDDLGGGEGQCVDGQQFIESDAPVGILVGGLDCAASYAYPGGLSLAPLWQPPRQPRG